MKAFFVNFSSVGQRSLDFSTVSRNLCLALCISVIASCGGGGDGGGSSIESEPSANNSPTLDTPGTIELPEEREVVITLNGTDLDGDSLTYSILGGTDHGVFNVAPEGTISFKATPNFEALAAIPSGPVISVPLRSVQTPSTMPAPLTWTVRPG